MGRPSKLDDLTAQAIVNAVAKGLPRDTAARLARVTPSTLFLWLRKGREGDPNYSEFSDRVRAAEAKGEEEIVGMLRTHAASSWQACAYLLGCRNPKRWSPKREAAADATRPVQAVTTEESIAIAESVLAALRSAS